MIPNQSPKNKIIFNNHGMNLKDENVKTELTSRNLSSTFFKEIERNKSYGSTLEAELMYRGLPNLWGFAEYPLIPISPSSNRFSCYSEKKRVTWCDCLLFFNVFCNSWYVLCFQASLQLQPLNPLTFSFLVGYS